MLGLGVLPAIIQLAIMIALPESPRWLFKQGEDTKALKVLWKIRLAGDSRSEELIEREAQEIKGEVEAEGHLTYREQLTALTGSLRRLTVLGVGLQVFQQLNGINTVLYYAPDILGLVGFDLSDEDAVIVSIPIAAGNMLGCMVGLFLVDHTGRRPLLLWSLPFLACALGSIATGTYFVVYQDASLQSVVFGFLIVYVFLFEIGMGPVPWVVNSEIFPVGFR